MSILLAELGLEYRVRPVNIRAGEQFAAHLAALNSYSKLPIVTWTEAGAKQVLHESGAILLYFAEAAGSLFPAAGPGRREALRWLMVVLTSLGPLSGEAHHWNRLSRVEQPAAAAYARAKLERLYSVLDRRLSESEYLASAYSIVDVAAFPWIERIGWTGLSLDDYPATRGWFARVAARPAVQAGMRVPAGVTLD